MPDPKKKVSTKPKTSAVSPERKTQELGDDLARAVAKKKMTMAQAQAEQAKRDAKVRKTKTVQNTTGKGGEGNPYHGKKRKAKFKRNRHGNLESY